MPTTISAHSNPTRLGQLLSLKPQHVYPKILHAIRVCVNKREDLEKMKVSLIDEMEIVEKLEHEHKRDKLKLTALECVLIVSGGVACFIPGIGWAVQGAILAGNAAVVSGVHRCDTNAEHEINEIIQQVNNKISDSVSFTNMVIDEKAKIDQIRSSLIDEGHVINDNHACNILVMDMLMEFLEHPMIRPPEGTKVDLDNDKTSNINKGLLNSIDIHAIVEKATWTFGEKILGELDFSPVVLHNLFAGAHILGLTINIYQFVETCLKSEKAPGIIEHYIEILDEGQKSLQFFISMLNYFRDYIIHETINRNGSEVDLEITDFSAQYEQSLNALRAELARHNEKFADHLTLDQLATDAVVTEMPALPLTDNQVQHEINYLKIDENSDKVENGINDSIVSEQNNETHNNVNCELSILHANAEDLGLIRSALQVVLRNTNHAIFYFGQVFRSTFRLNAANNEVESDEIFDGKDLSEAFDESEYVII